MSSRRRVSCAALLALAVGAARRSAGGRRRARLRAGTADHRQRAPGPRRSARRPVGGQRALPAAVPRAAPVRAPDRRNRGEPAPLHARGRARLRGAHVSTAAHDRAGDRAAGRDLARGDRGRCCRRRSTPSAHAPRSRQRRCDAAPAPTAPAPAAATGAADRRRAQAVAAARSPSSGSPGRCPAASATWARPRRCWAAGSTATSHSDQFAQGRAADSPRRAPGCSRANRRACCSCARSLADAADALAWRRRWRRASPACGRASPRRGRASRAAPRVRDRAHARRAGPAGARGEAGAGDGAGRPSAAARPTAPSSAGGGEERGGRRVRLPAPDARARARDVLRPDLARERRRRDARRDGGRARGGGRRRSPS